jgi:hypothetical protein
MPGAANPFFQIVPHQQGAATAPGKFEGEQPKVDLGLASDWAAVASPKVRR